jgi:hypothetical protein
MAERENPVHQSRAGQKAWATIISAINRKGVIEDFDGPPVFAQTMEEAEAACERLFPYARVVEHDQVLQKLTDKLFNDVD